MAGTEAEKVPLPPDAGHSILQNEDNLIEKSASSGTGANNDASSSESSITDDRESEEIQPRYTPIRGRSYRDYPPDRTVSQTYGPITDMELNELRDIASLQRSRTQPSAAADGLERKDTLVGVTDDDPRLNPDLPEFDIYIWARRQIRAMDEGNIKWARAGFTFKDLNVSGSGNALSFQSTVADVLMAPLRLNETLNFGHKPRNQILRSFEGVVRSGEMLIVLGRPGSGCTTFLKTICGELAGLNLDPDSTIHYNGIPQSQMLKEFKGELAYNQETDKHFPHLTVGQTLAFAAAARTPQKRVKDAPRQEVSELMTKVVMAVFGLSHTKNTKVGDDFIRGVSGGERKVRKLLESHTQGHSLLQCWVTDVNSSN